MYFAPSPARALAQPPPPPSSQPARPRGCPAQPRRGRPGYVPAQQSHQNRVTERVHPDVSVG